MQPGVRQWEQFSANVKENEGSAECSLCNVD